MRNVRGLIEDFRTARREDQAVTPVVGALGGVALAFAVERYGPAPDAADFTITVAQARSSLLSALALVFTGLSIVLALTALAAGNMASKFSPRMLRMRLSGGGNKWVLGAFAATASFIITSQILLRGRPSEGLAPPLVLSVGVVLLILTGVMIVWYINGTLQSMRVDRAIHWIGQRIHRALKAHERAIRDDEVVAEIDLHRPTDAVDLLAPADGYFADVDMGSLHRIASKNDGCLVITTLTGHAVVQGEEMGWISGSSPIDEQHMTEIVDALTITSTRDPERDIGYVIGVLVDIALMALSPAVNDPRTGVDCTEKLTEAWTAMAAQRLGIRTRKRSDGSPSVVLLEDSMGDFLDAAGRQILLYGADDRTVTAALLRMAQQAERTATCDHDRRLARALAADVEAARGESGS